MEIVVDEAVDVVGGGKTVYGSVVDDAAVAVLQYHMTQHARGQSSHGQLVLTGTSRFHGHHTHGSTWGVAVGGGY